MILLWALEVDQRCAVDDSLRTTELCAITLGQAKVRQKSGLGSGTGSNNVL